jgi:hypothetical protein
MFKKKTVLQKCEKVFSVTRESLCRDCLEYNLREIFRHFQKKRYTNRFNDLLCI